MEIKYYVLDLYLFSWNVTLDENSLQCLQYANTKHQIKSFEDCTFHGRVFRYIFEFAITILNELPCLT
jgi:hypothetical protein